MSSSPALHPERVDGAPHVPARSRAAGTRRRLRPARPRPGRRLVERPRLVAPLVEGTRPLAVLAAPAGFGKSTLLGQWRAGDPRPFASVALSAAHDDPGRLLAAIAGAVAQLGAPAGFASPPASLEDVTALLAALPPCVLALDDVHVLRSPAAEAIVAYVALAVPEGTTLALAGRRDPALALARLRAQDDVVELRAKQLAMTRAEAGALLAHAGPAISPAQVDRLYERTSGWPAALQLAARAVREQDDVAAAIDAFVGDDTGVADYVRQEVLSELAPEDRAFLRRTAMLDRLGSAVCDAALGQVGSAATLRRLARANVPLIALDRSDHEFRLQPLVRQALNAELRRAEPALEALLHRRVSAWQEREGDVELAIHHAVQARDAGRTEELLADRCAAFVAAGRADIVDRWLRALGTGAVEARPGLAIAAALAGMMLGECDTADRWAAIAAGRAEAGGDAPDVASRALLVRAWTARRGVSAMVADARAACAPTPPYGPWRSLACLVAGSGLCLAGDEEAATERLEEGALCGSFDAPLVRSLCLAELAFLGLGRGEPEEASTLAARARKALERGRCELAPLAALTYAVSALADAERGRVDDAQEHLGQASRRLDALADVTPWYEAMTRVALARARLKLSDAGEGRRLLSEAARLRRLVDGAVALQGWIDEGWALADDYAAGPVACPSTLTTAELRVLRLLPSHLTYREIGTRLHVSPNTVKTQAHAVYRKLDARSRSEAVAHAAELGLVDTRITRSW